MRFTNKDVICQITNATVAGDVVVAQARSQELKQFGLEVGLTNYAAAYATGLLVARRVLTRFELADTYKGTEEATGVCSQACGQDFAQRGAGSGLSQLLLDQHVDQSCAGGACLQC